MANLFKLQIGGARHWNVYVHSFLYFGVNGAWDRLNARLRQDESFGLVVRNATGFVNPCLPAGSSIPYSSWIHTDGFGHLLPRSNPLSTVYNTIMYNEQPDFELCREKTRRLLRKEVSGRSDTSQRETIGFLISSNTCVTPMYAGKFGMGRLFA